MKQQRFCLSLPIHLCFTLQATLPGFLSRGLSIEEGESLLKKSVKLAVEARDSFWDSIKETSVHGQNRALVAASIGSYGAYLADGSEYRYFIHNTMPNSVTSVQYLCCSFRF